MKNRNILAIFVGVSLVLFFAFKVLAQTSAIEGWDKAKFGMTPEEVREAYSAEEKYFEEKYKIDSLFWFVQEEGESLWFVVEEGKFSPWFPYTLTTPFLKVLGREAGINFRFVENELFRIEIMGAVAAPSKDWGRESISKRISEAGELQSNLWRLRRHLFNKYGEPFEIEKTERKVILTWKDDEGDSLILGISYDDKFEWQGMYYDFPGYYIIYSDKELTELWKKKVAKWKEGKGKLEEKGVGSF